MTDTVQQIKDKLSITDVIAPYVKLTRAGKYMRGLSPFNKEKTPSFYVNPERGTYYCFSSGQGGDHFTFIEKMEGVDFKGAMKVLAEKAGVEIVYAKSEDRGQKDRLLSLMGEAEAYFVEKLGTEGMAHEYALGRGLTPATISLWRIGYAPEGWRTLLEAMTAKGYKIEELVSAGLVKEADEKKGTYYDRFRNRLMFPIRDTAGRTVAFTGRALSPDDQAKYLNSPETELFKKSQVLFGMSGAKDAIRTRGFALLVEGQFDLVLLHQIGFTNTVALSGTALSREHLALISRYAPNLMLALDADRAGLAASAKNAQAALHAGMRVKAVRLPLGKDPADLAKDTPQDFVRRVQEAESIIEFFLSVLAASETDPHRLVIAVERIVLPLVASVKSPLEREHFIGIVARALGSSPEAVRAAVPRAATIPAEPDEPVAVSGTAPKEPASPSEARGLLILAAIHAYPGTALAGTLSEEYARIIGVPPEANELPERALFEAGLLFGETPEPGAGHELIQAFERSVVSERLLAATARLRRAELAKDDTAIQTAVAEVQTLGARFAALP